MDHQQLLDTITAKFPDAGIEVLTDITPAGFSIKKEHLIEVCRFLHSEEGFYFDMLACVTGMDNGPEAGTMEVIYNFNSIPYNRQLTVKVILPRNDEELSVPSVSEIWRTAEWHEREIYDLFGIHFTGHPDLRRILLPADWEGHPLRKDYKNMETYHGIIVD